MQVTTTILLGLIIVAGAILYAGGAFPGLQPQEAVAEQEATTEALSTLSLSAECPDTKITTVDLNVLNSENNTASEERPSWVYYYKVNGDVDDSVFVIVTDSQASTASLTCNDDYETRLRSTNAANGNSSRIDSFTGDDVAGIVEGENGQAGRFKATGQRQTLTMESPEHGTIQARVYDRDAAAYLVDADTGGLGYQTLNNTWRGATNGSATVVGVDGQIDFRIDYQSVQSDAQFNDQSFLVVINAGTGVWQEPTVTFGGDVFTNIEGGLSVGCNRLLADDEYVYKIEGADFPSAGAASLEVAMKALSGINPGTSDSVRVTLVAVGTYLSVDSSTGSGHLNADACTDAASPGYVYDPMSLNFDVS